MDSQKRHVANETPEQRQKRLQRYKIYQATKKLKKELEESGMSVEEIQEKVDGLVQEMKAQPLPPPSQYKPRDRTKKTRKLEQLEREMETESIPTSTVNVPSVPTSGFTTISENAPSPASAFHDYAQNANHDSDNIEDISCLDENEEASSVV